MLYMYLAKMLIWPARKGLPSSPEVRPQPSILLVPTSQLSDGPDSPSNTTCCNVKERQGSSVGCGVAAERICVSLEPGQSLQRGASRLPAANAHLLDSLKVPLLVQDARPLCVLLPGLPICFAPALLLCVQKEYLQRANAIVSPSPYRQRDKMGLCAVQSHIKEPHTIPGRRVHYGWLPTATGIDRQETAGFDFPDTQPLTGSGSLLCSTQLSFLAKRQHILKRAKHLGRPPWCPQQ